MDVFELLLRILIPISSTIFLGGATLLYLQSKENRSRRILSYIMFLWGLVYFFRIIGINTGRMVFFSVDLWDPLVLIFGNLFIIVLLCYPLEIVLPGWLTQSRLGLILLPYLTIVFIFYITMFLLGEKQESFQDYETLQRSLTHFNVWYRFIIFCSIFIYTYLLLRIIYKYEVRYQKWCNDCYSSKEQIDISWLRYYALCVFVIGVAYIGLLANGQSWTAFIHNLVSCCSFAFIAYKGLFHKNPYPEGFFRQTTDESEAEIAIQSTSFVAITSKIEVLKDDLNTIDASFSNKIPFYIELFNQWMDSKQPYLNKNFKLVDVAEILPLNRSYLSRLFNEGMGQSFSDIVKTYRLRDAKLLLSKHPDLSIMRIALICGFSSASSFNRTFLQAEGMTPKQYREQNNSTNT